MEAARTNHRCCPPIEFVHVTRCYEEYILKNKAITRTDLKAQFSPRCLDRCCQRPLTMSKFSVITEFAELEGTHQNHRVLLLGFNTPCDGFLTYGQQTALFTQAWPDEIPWDTSHRVPHKGGKGSLPA